MARRILVQVDEDDAPLRPTLIVAGYQTGGHGRGSNEWASPPGGLYLNWLSGCVESAAVALLPMIAAVSALRALDSVGVKNVGVKWPNDLLIDGRKIAGLLVHCRHAEKVLTTIGLGVNIAQTPTLNDEKPLHLPTSVIDVLGESDPTDLASRIVITFLENLKSSFTRPEKAVSLWKQLLVHREGAAFAVRLASGDVVRGSFAGVTKAGHVRVLTDEGERTLTGGDVIED